MERAVIYTRVSGIKQNTNQSSEGQTETCLNFANSRNWIVKKENILHDTQSGADFTSRKSVQESLRLLRLRLCDYVIFSVIDRMGRDFTVFEQFSKEIYRTGGK